MGGDCIFDVCDVEVVVLYLTLLDEVIGYSRYIVAVEIPPSISTECTMALGKKSIRHAGEGGETIGQLCCTKT